MCVFTGKLLCVIESSASIQNLYEIAHCFYLSRFYNLPTFAQAKCYTVILYSFGSYPSISRGLLELLNCLQTCFFTSHPLPLSFNFIVSYLRHFNKITTCFPTSLIPLLSVLACQNFSVFPYPPCKILIAILPLIKNHSKDGFLLPTG